MKLSKLITDLELRIKETEDAKHLDDPAALAAISAGIQALVTLKKVAAVRAQLAQQGVLLDKDRDEL